MNNVIKVWNWILFQLTKKINIKQKKLMIQNLSSYKNNR